MAYPLMKSARSSDRGRNSNRAYEINKVA